MNLPLVSVLPDQRVLAATVAARLALALGDAQAQRGSASVALTGGTIAARAYAALRDSELCQAVDWSLVDVWWGDERFLPSGHADRNETQARAALLGNRELVSRIAVPFALSALAAAGVVWFL